VKSLLRRKAGENTERRAIEQCKDGLEPTACHHHWIIEPPTGPTSKGQCMHCSAEHEFQNSFGPFLWGDYGEVAERPFGIESYNSLTLDEQE